MIIEAWEKVIKHATPMQELGKIVDQNFEKFQETADLFTEFRRHKVFQAYRSDLSASYDGYLVVGDVLNILKGLVFRA